MNESKREIREQLLEFAKREKLLHDSRIGYMEDWLKKKKLNEAYNIMQMRDHKKQEEIENEAKNQLQN